LRLPSLAARVPGHPAKVAARRERSSLQGGEVESAVAASNPVQRSAHPALDSIDQVRPQLRGLDDPLHRADLHRSLDAVDGVELGREFAQLLRADVAQQIVSLAAHLRALTDVGAGDRFVEFGDLLVGLRALVDLACELERLARRRRRSRIWSCQLGSDSAWEHGGGSLPDQH
jgi:hypothetical protein